MENLHHDLSALCLYNNYVKPASWFICPMSVNNYVKPASRFICPMPVNNYVKPESWFIFTTSVNNYVKPASRFIITTSVNNYVIQIPKDTEGYTWIGTDLKDFVGVGHLLQRLNKGYLQNFFSFFFFFTFKLKCFSWKGFNVWKYLQNS